jgi:hypothetical protein
VIKIEEWQFKLTHMTVSNIFEMACLSVQPAFVREKDLLPLLHLPFRLLAELKPFFFVFLGYYWHDPRFERI